MHLFLLGLESSDPLTSLFEDYLSDRLQSEPIGNDLENEPKYTLSDSMGFSVPCRICTKTDQWIREGLVFVCRHPPMDLVPWLDVIDSIRCDKVIGNECHWKS